MWVAIVFTTARPGQRPATPGQMCDLITERLPGLCASLARGTGAGQVAPMTPEQIVAIARTAYDPGAAGLFDAAAAAGIDHGLTWAQAGPVAADEAWDHLRHDGATSITYKMTSAPAGDVPARVLAPLLDPSPGPGPQTGHPDLPPPPGRRGRPDRRRGPAHRRLPGRGTPRPGPLRTRRRAG